MTDSDSLSSRAADDEEKRLSEEMASIELTREGKKLFPPALLQEMMDWHNRLCPRPTHHSELMLAIEKEFGERLIEEICEPHQLTHYACLVVAAELLAPDGGTTEEPA